LERRAKQFLYGIDGIVDGENEVDFDRIDYVAKRYDSALNKVNPFNESRQVSLSSSSRSDNRGGYIKGAVGGGSHNVLNSTTWVLSNGGQFPRISFYLHTEPGKCYQFTFDYFVGSEHQAFIAVSSSTSIQDGFIYIEGITDSRRITHEFTAHSNKSYVLIGVASTQPGAKFGVRRFYAEHVLPRLKPILSQKPFKEKRILVTSFNAAYFDQGVTLINSIARTSNDLIDSIYIYDLGLNLKQISILDRFDKVKLLKYSDSVEVPYSGYLKPKNYAYKCHAFADVAQYGRKGDLVLWLDSGVAPLQSLSSIYNFIRKDGYFFVDHNEVEGWPIFNVSFTHPSSFEALGTSVRDLLGKHLCSAVMGYRIGSTYHKLARDAHRISHSEAAIMWSKHPPETDKRSGKSYEDRAQVLKTIRRQTIESVVEAFPFFGHRQDQSIFSVLAAQYRCNLSPGIYFRRGSKFSSYISKQNWQSGGESFLNQYVNSLEDVDSSTVIYQHRGVYKHLHQKLLHKKRSKSLLVLGNGPSLAEWDFNEFTNFDSVGCNSAYRHWKEISWYPSYYACLDETVLDSHKDEIVELIQNRNSNGIRLFFLRKSILESYQFLTELDEVVFLEDLFELYRGFHIEPITTGSHSSLLAAFLGYEKVVIFGVDLNYVEKVDGAISTEGTELLITEDIKFNPNYFFKGYQCKGDRFNVPNPSKNLHLRAWQNVKVFLERSGIVLYNANSNSKLSNVGQVGNSKLEDIENRELGELCSRLDSETCIGKFLISEKEKDAFLIDLRRSLVSTNSNEEIDEFQFVGGKSILQFLIHAKKISCVCTKGINSFRKLCKYLVSSVKLPNEIAVSLEANENVHNTVLCLYRLGYFPLVCSFQNGVCRFYNEVSSMGKGDFYYALGTKAPYQINHVFEKLGGAYRKLDRERLEIRPTLITENFRKTFEADYKVSFHENLCVAVKRSEMENSVVRVVIVSTEKITSIRMASIRSKILAECVYCAELEKVVPFDQEALNGLFIVEGVRGSIIDIIVNCTQTLTLKLDV